MRSPLSKIIASVFLACLLYGCSGVSSTAPIRYYLVDPIKYPKEQFKADRSLSIEIISLHIPQYLERFHIATRTSKSQLEFSEAHQWGENLRKNLLRTMSRNLSALLSTLDIGTPLNRSASLPDYRVQIHIEQFELESNQKVKLVARWQLSSKAQSKPLGVFNAELQGEETIKKGNYEQMVLVMRQLYGDLCERIAKTIITYES
ncbi:MAG: membrane integrity-associated transporter subunit PqiC [Nitrospinae bacterium]|nr:membrane integrity-associated transporter subunit PqiC [Nitrospinota bacterium]MZH45844.1 membrane integrity-associated transporter subunit PqiC [Nitrospinota bacterium]